MTDKPRAKWLPIALILLLIALVVAAVLVQSSRPAPTPAPQPTSTGAAATEISVTPPPFVPGGTAQENFAYFNWVNKRTISANPAVGSLDFVNGLTDAGFDRAAMQRTPDRTAIDLAADSVQFSVQAGEWCLIGQFGDGSDGYRSVVAPVVPGVGCLVGVTAPLD